MTLRRRILRYVAAAAALSCALTVAVAIVLVRGQLSHQRLRALERQADVVSAIGGAPGALTPGEHVYVLNRLRPRRVGPRRSALILARIPDPTVGQGQLTLAGRSYLYAARRTGDGAVVLIAPAALLFGEWRPFLVSLLLAGAGGLLLAAAVSWLLARRLSAPIGELSQATGRLAGGALDVRVRADGDDELAELGRAFNRMAADLAQARAAQQGFLESVSHELKTPLTSIRGYAEAAVDGAVAADRAIPIIGAEAQRLERLVGDLLDLARLQRAEFTVEREDLVLREVAEEIVRRHAPAAAALGVTLALDSQAAAPARADRGRLLQAVSNLVENALRLTPEGGRVEVRTRPGEIAVADTGPGLSPEDLPHAFERFYLHRRYASERPVGTGLGLAIVAGLVERMAGTVDVTVPPEGGTVFTVRLPAGRAAGARLTPSVG